MLYVLVVTKAQANGVGANLAYQIALELLQQKHDIQQIFFLHEGVHNGNSLIDLPTDETNIVKMWQDLHQSYNIKLNICVTIGQRRGVVAEKSLAKGFCLSGLLEYAEALLNSDRVITI